MRCPARNLGVEYRVVDTTSRAALEALDIPAYDHVLVLGYSDLLAAQPADTRTLVTLLHLRKIAENAGKHISVVSEMIDVRNRELAEVTRADDFVVSNKLVSLMLAQASRERISGGDLRRPARRGRLRNLHAAGRRLCRRPTSRDLLHGRRSRRRRGEVAIGYRRRRKDEADGRGIGGVVVNPVKSLSADLRAGRPHHRAGAGVASATSTISA